MRDVGLVLQDDAMDTKLGMRLTSAGEHNP